MLNEFSMRALAGSWLTAVGLVAGCGLAVGVTMTPGATVLLVGLALMPPTMMLLLARRGAAPIPQAVRDRASHA
jgi:hypothetical protein